MRRLALALVFVVASAVPPSRRATPRPARAVYERKCLLCHGDKGDGKGPGAEHLVPKPRDFTKGLYKIRTSSNKTPFDQDLHKIVTDGMPGTSMPSWAVLPRGTARIWWPI